MKKILYGFYWDDEATNLIEMYSDKLPMVRNLWLESDQYISYKENEVINIQIEKSSGLTVESAVKKIRKFVNLNKEDIQSSEAYLSINIMLCLTDINKVRNFLDENLRIYNSNLSQRELFNRE